MATNAQAQQEVHWKDRLISKAEAISDAFDVAKAYGAHVANWILFFCLIGNIIEMFSLPEPFASIFGNIILGVQVVTLDIAGFGLTAMGSSAKSRGDTKAANKATGMGITLISIMIVTAGLITTSIIFPGTKPTIDLIDKGLMLVRVLVTVLYGHIVHSLRHASEEHDNRTTRLEQEVSDMQKQLAAKHQEIAQGEKRFADLQKTLSGVQIQMSNEREAARVEMETLRGKLEIKAREIEMMGADQAGIITLRRELNAVKLQADDLQSQLDAKSQALKSEQLLSSNLRREVERLQKSETQQYVPPMGGTLHSGTTSGAKLVPLLQRSRTSGTPQVERETGPHPAIETGENANAKALIYRLLDEDNTRQVADVMRLTSLAKTTVWRHWNRWHEEHGTRDLARLASGETAQSETA